MANLKEIRTRISTVKGTQKITRAMKLVAAARLRKAQQAITELRPFAVKTHEVLSSVAARTAEEDKVHALLERRDPDQVMLVVITSDRGLAGAFNASICKAAHLRWDELTAAGSEVCFAVIGKKGRDYFRRRGADIRHDFTGIFDDLDLSTAGGVGARIVAEYTDSAHSLDACYLIYNEFKSAISQEVVMEPLLPITPMDLSDDEDGEHIYEPGRTDLLDRLLPLYVDVEVYRALLESVASEHGARMTAMDAATNNASEMIDTLTLQYNRARQAAITTELMEIIGGAEALKG